MGKTLYLECYSGISGDMTVGALLDLGADKAVLDRVLQSLPVSGFQIKTGKVVKSGIAACDFDVMLDENHENHSPALSRSLERRSGYLLLWRQPAGPYPARQRESASIAGGNRTTRRKREGGDGWYPRP